MIVGAARVRERVSYSDNRLGTARRPEWNWASNSSSHLAAGTAVPKIGGTNRDVRLRWPAGNKGGTMKGPGMRLDLDVRRVWECPECHRQMRSDGQATSRICGCTREGVAMRLVELPRPKPQVRVPEPPNPESDETQLADFPTDIPVHPPVKRAPPTNPDDPDFPAVSWNREPAPDDKPPADPVQ
jgi:hypothetical protein